MRWPAWLFLLGLLGALWQPRWGADEEALQARGIDLLVCLDVSQSMLARDVAPDRLQRAKEELAALVAALGQDRIGLVIFAGEAQRAAPLTREMQSFLDLVAVAEPGSVAKGGTDLAAALDRAQKLLAAAPGVQKNVLLISDGEDRAGQGLEAAARCAAEGIVVHTLGVGSEQGGKITVTAADGTEQFLRDQQGREILTRPSREDLRAIADASGGRALWLDASNTAHVSHAGDLPAWYRDTLLPSARAAAVEDPDLPRANRYQWPLGLALLGLLLSLAGVGRRRR